MGGLEAAEEEGGEAEVVGEDVWMLNRGMGPDCPTIAAATAAAYITCGSGSGDPRNVRKR